MKSHYKISRRLRTSKKQYRSIDILDTQEGKNNTDNLRNDYKSFNTTKRGFNLDIQEFMSEKGIVENTDHRDKRFKIKLCPQKYLKRFEQRLRTKSISQTKINYNNRFQNSSICHTITYGLDDVEDKDVSSELQNISLK
jgi:hypothetical protein